MKFHRAFLDTCSQAEGTVVSIDVLRAFSTAAYAFAAGAAEIMLVSTVQAALELRDRFSEALVMGEVDGLPVKGFDFSNSPADLAGQDLSGRRLIQRTSSGTQGIVGSQRAQELLASSFVCAGATARYLQTLQPAQVTFVITGYRSPGGPHNHPPGLGDEDAACADYLEARLRGEMPDFEPFRERVRQSPSGQIFSASLRPEFSAVDLDYCLAVDRFDFAMRVERQGDLFVMRPVR